MSLVGKVALITGASRGIGQAIALELGRQGVTVIGTATTEEGAQSITAAFKEHGIKGNGIQLNVTDTQAIDRLLEQSGSELPQILVNNAAITRDNLLLRIKNEEWEEVINVNLNSVYYVTRACLKGMLKARWGRVINISSVVGFTGNPGQCNYAAAKSALAGFTMSLAQEIASRGITVNQVAPGFIDTDMTKGLSEAHKSLLLNKIPVNRLGEPREIAYAVAFLASENAGYITGQTLHVNGGMYMN